MSAPRSKATKAARKPAPVDFDKIRKQKTQVLRDLPPVKISGKSYTLRPTLPLSVTDRFAENARHDENGDTKVLLTDMQFILGELFGPDAWAEIRRNIGIEDVPDLFTTVFDLYGEAVGESSDSGES